MENHITGSWGTVVAEEKPDVRGYFTTLHILISNDAELCFTGLQRFCVLLNCTGEPVPGHLKRIVARGASVLSSIMKTPQNYVKWSKKCSTRTTSQACSVWSAPWPLLGLSFVLAEVSASIVHSAAVKLKSNSSIQLNPSTSQKSETSTSISSSNKTHIISKRYLNSRFAHSQLGKMIFKIHRVSRN